MRNLSLLTLLAACLAVGGCQSKPKPADSGALVKTTDRDQHLISANNAYKLGYNLLWAQTVPVNVRTEKLDSYIVGDKAVIVQSPTNVVTVLNIKSGRILWAKVVGRKLEPLLGVQRVKNRLLVNSDSVLYVFDAENGQRFGRQDLIEVVAAGPALVDDVAVFGGIDGTIFAHDLKTGDARWKYKVKAGLRTAPIGVGGTQVFVADNSGYYALFDAFKGERLWQGSTYGPITGQPIASNLGIIFPSNDHNLYALNRADGQDRLGWPYRTNVALKDHPTLMGRYLFQVIPGRGLVTIDATRKKDLWVGDENAKPVGMNKKGLILQLKNRLQIVDPSTGEKLNEVAVQPLNAIKPGPDNSLILVSPKGRILRLDPA